MKMLIVLLMFVECLWAQDLGYLNPVLRNYLDDVLKYINFINGDKELVLSKYPEEARNHLTAIEINSEIVKSILLDMNTEDFKKLVDKRKEAYYFDTYSIMKFRKEYDKKITKKLETNIESNFITIGGFEGIFNLVMLEKYNKNVAQLHFGHYFLRIKIIDRYNDVYESSGMKFSRNIYKAKIEDFIKGGKKIKIGDVISFYSMDFWSYENNSLEIDNSYFLGLDVIVDKNFKEQLALRVTGEEILALPIVDEEINDSDSEYGVGRVIKWPDFKKSLISIFNSY